MTETDSSRAAGRSIRLLRPPSSDGAGVCIITMDKRSTYYAFAEIPCEIGGRGFAMHRLGLGTLYHLRVGEPVDCECECKGFLRWGYCRHVLGLLALLREGKI